MVRGRAQRRHDAERVKRRVRTYYGGWAGRSPRNIGMVARTHQICSCLYCGNPRRYEGPTRQERRADDEALEW